MTEFEIDLLKLVADGKGQWGWYQLGTRIPGRDLHRASEMMKVLHHLADEGFINQYVEPDTPMDRWELTEKGQDFLKSIPDDPETEHDSQ